MGPLQPNPADLLLGLFCFLLTFAILARVVLPRIAKVLAERDDAIGGGMARAEAAQADAQQAYDEYKRELLAARREAAALVQEAREQGAQLIAEARAEGLRQQQAMVASAHAQLAEERARADAALRRDIEGLSVELAGRILGEPVDQVARERGTAERFFAELAAKGDAAHVAS